ncbi:hypothetical protein E3O44_13530 [Cryobacterium algoricola]|uniref:Uncharacterized protein n=1 Tax=Cryobacterium algoricola TaxID=1259183 RepID=A0ABY2IDE8_9MICO|nr:hypothetical protein [Cryobacterium algoricola]TFB85602.1 hypothetical protein E3O44_13530 [Cryobacterium algoricola]
MSSSLPETQPPDPDSVRSARQIDLNSIHPLLLEKFGTPKALPKAISVYFPEHGWDHSMKREVLNLGLVRNLRSNGATLVVAKWRRIERQFTLTALDFPVG